MSSDRTGHAASVKYFRCLFDIFTVFSPEKEQGREHLQTPRAEQRAPQKCQKHSWREKPRRDCSSSTRRITHTQQSVNSENV